jgi:hypothetical protein
MNQSKVYGAAVIALAIVVSSFVFRNAWIKGKKGNETISVTGLASKDFTSDLIVWKGQFFAHQHEYCRGIQRFKA